MIKFRNGLSLHVDTYNGVPYLVLRDTRSYCCGEMNVDTTRIAKLSDRVADVLILLLNKATHDT